MWRRDEVSIWRRALARFRSHVPAEVDDELRFHFDSRVEDLVREGLSRGAARARAVEEFGDVATVREGLVAIDARMAARRGRLELLRDVFDDLAYTTRSLLRAPGFAATVIVTLALGVGANAIMFSLLDAIFVRPPAGVVDPASVRRLWVQRNYSTGRQYSTVLSYPEYAAAARALGNRASTAVYTPAGTATSTIGATPVDVQRSLATSTFFTTVGARPLIGRFYNADEDALTHGAAVAVVSERFWRSALGGTSAALGRTITFSGTRYTIIGVADGGFTGVELNATDVWLPLASRGAPGDKTPWWENPRVNGLAMVFRPHTTESDDVLEQRITAALRQPGVSLTTDSLLVARFGGLARANGPGVRSQEERIAVRLAGVALIVLLIACANVVNLLMSRAVRRRREIAVRLALGISRARLMRLLVSESAVLAVVAGAISVALAYFGGLTLRALLLPDVHWSTAPTDWRVVLVTVAIAVGAGCLAGLVPALQSIDPELTPALKTGAISTTAARSKLRSSLVMVQAGLSVVLLVGALLFVRSLRNVQSLDIGFDRDRLLTTGPTFQNSDMWKDPTIPARLAELAGRVARVPGVQRSALASMAPMYGFSWADFFTEHDSLGSRPHWMPTYTSVGAHYFETTGLRFLRGRGFPDGKANGTHGVVVNEEMAHGLWPGRDPLGQCIHFGSRTAPCYTVIGVVENGRMTSVLESPSPMYYLSLSDLPDTTFNPAYHVLVRMDPTRLAAISTAVRSLIKAEFPASTPVLRSMNDQLDPQYRPWRLGASLFTAFGLLALAVAVVGIYGTVSYGVNQRVHEFGVRIALGARITDVLHTVVGEGLRTVAIGVAIGIVLALAAGRLVGSLLYGVRAYDPLSIVSVAIALLVVGAAAALVPAWRAARVDPVIALRAD
jgi:predicted permease